MLEIPGVLWKKRANGMGIDWGRNGFVCVGVFLLFGVKCVGAYLSELIA